MKAKQKSLHFLIVDDDKTSVDIYRRLLEKSGHQVTIGFTSTEAIKNLEQEKIQPDCILSDLMMPDMDGLELFQRIRKMSHIKQPSFIIISGKVFEFDRRRALEAGVDGYLTKPIDPDNFVNDILEIANHNMTIQFWGVRGTLPVPGPKTLRYGGNTNCVTLSFAKKEFFIFDAGTGIKALSTELMKNVHAPISAKIFITHPHYDHINGLPFFVPLYVQGNEFEILGTNHGEISIGKLISDQMDSVYFPITIKEFAAKLSFRNLKEETIKIQDLDVSTILLNHPGRCIGFRVQYKDKSFCYITDNELYLEDSEYNNQFEVERLVQFIEKTDVLVIDATYTDKEYLTKIGWGHSCVSRVVDIAHKAKVKLLCLYHHDLDEFDKDIDLKLKSARERLKSLRSKTRCVAPKEGSKIII